MGLHDYIGKALKRKDRRNTGSIAILLVPDIHAIVTYAKLIFLLARSICFRAIYSISE